MTLLAGDLVVMDIGDVLVRTVPMAQYRALAAMTGLHWAAIREAIEARGVISGFETGRLSGREFTRAVRRTLGYPRLADAEIRNAWNAVIGAADPMIAEPATRLAACGCLLLASNTNPYHWRQAKARLASVGVTAPALLSFKIGVAKPDPRFFAALTSQYPVARNGAVYIDDQVANVAAVTAHGLTGWLHHDRSATAAYLTALATRQLDQSDWRITNADSGVRRARES